ncbi:colicin immunity domain-containing protein [Herbaspirillum sp. WGmk3]|uniref:colicin immunity domain-containing protein n=1 Tax=Herbaspirillum sp. WGmk3 TaxID=2919925 RepID=UPI0020919202|nr:colicin immunity domain-containing protein [Herbaspirillum sp. WGmk3]MCO4857949.1 colicin immunity domain-containing protein [Herbaspirillum sp. WGmk3]
MSEKLLASAKTYLNNESNSERFVSDFIEQWKRERDSGESRLDSPKVSEVLSSIFCLTDLFNPDDDRESYELDEDKLRNEIRKLMEQADFL